MLGSTKAKLIQVVFSPHLNKIFETTTYCSCDMYRDNTRTMRKTPFSNYFHLDLELLHLQTKTWRIPTRKKIYLEMSHGWYRDATRGLDSRPQSSTRDPKKNESPHGKVNFGRQTVSLQSKFDRHQFHFLPNKLGKFQLFVTKAIAKFTTSS